MPEFVELETTGNEIIYVNPNWVVWIKHYNENTCSLRFHDGGCWEIKGSAEAIKLLLSGRIH